jgi:glycine dehydrogenase subunit 1
MSFTCLSESDKKSMLDSIGVSSVEELFKDIPDSIKLSKKLDLPEKMSEQEVLKHMHELAGKNKHLHNYTGAGSYGHYIPAVIDHLTSRSEFYTAYTPYQPEVSQGTLTAIFEFQSMMCSLTGMDISNASLYDGATSLAEAVLMAVRSNNKSKVIVSDAVHPHYREVLDTYAWANDIEVKLNKSSQGITDPSSVSSDIDDSVSAVIIQSPNFFGSIEDVEEFSKLLKSKKIFLIQVITDTVSLGLLKKPSELGSDIVCGEAMSFGNPIGFGGPCLGFVACSKAFMRKMPGRLIGKTIDSAGNPCYVLTLQTREQHIRRERATSNICTNEGLCALRAVMYLSSIGPKLNDIAKLNHKVASHLKSKLSSVGIKSEFNNPYFNEFVVKVPGASAMLKKLREKNISFGIELSKFYDEYKDHVLVCCTEQNTPDEIDYLIDCIKEAK